MGISTIQVPGETIIRTIGLRNRTKQHNACRLEDLKVLRLETHYIVKHTRTSHSANFNLKSTRETPSHLAITSVMH